MNALRLMAAAMLVALGGLAQGQVDPGFASSGNVSAAAVIPKDQFRVMVDWRDFGHTNQNWTLEASYGLSERLQASINYVDFTSEGLPAIAGAVRRSEFESYGLTLRYLGAPIRPNELAWAIQPGIELHGKSRGTNLALGTFAEDNDTILTVAVPLSYQHQTTVWTLEPRMAFFDDSVPTYALPGAPAPPTPTIDNWGTVVGLGLGIAGPVDKDWTFFADVTPILSGYNAVNPRTNALETELVWWLGARHSSPFGVRDLWLDVYWTNSAGRTPATSLIAAPDGSNAVGLALTYRP